MTKPGSATSLIGVHKSEALARTRCGQYVSSRRLCTHPHGCPGQRPWRLSDKKTEYYLQTKMILDELTCSTLLPRVHLWLLRAQVHHEESCGSYTWSPFLDTRDTDYMEDESVSIDPLITDSLVTNSSDSSVYDLSDIKGNPILKIKRCGGLW